MNNSVACACGDLKCKNEITITQGDLEFKTIELAAYSTQMDCTVSVMLNETAMRELISVLETTMREVKEVSA
jgi:hypothetical protein